MERDLTNVSNEGAKSVGWNIIVPFPGEVVGKAVLELADGSIMKSTKRFKVDGGYIYNTSTEYHKGERVSITEALVFVPDQK